MRKNITRIWFNRWFSTGIEFINLIKENDYEKQFEIYVTHHENRIEFINLADYFELEKKIYGLKTQRFRYLANRKKVFP